jgi:hypothetical protein
LHIAQAERFGARWRRRVSFVFIRRWLVLCRFLRNTIRTAPHGTPHIMFMGRIRARHAGKPGDIQVQSCGGLPTLPRTLRGRGIEPPAASLNAEEEKDESQPHFQ